MFAGSIIEAVWPLGFPVRLNWLLVELSTSELAATFTRSLLAQEVHPEDGEGHVCSQE
jgi:hypothetical protein